MATIKKNTYGVVVMDILQNMKQIFKDATITPVQVLWWVQVVANRLRYQRIKEMDMAGRYLTTYPKVTVLMDNNFKPFRHYIEIPESVYDFESERGVDYISYWEADRSCCDGPVFTDELFSWTKPSIARSLFWNKDTTPSTKMPFAYRVGDRIYFLGTECIKLDFVEIGLYAALSPGHVCSWDEEIPLGPEQIIHIWPEIQRIGLFALQTPRERVADGADTFAQMAAQKGGIKEMRQPQQQEAE